MTSKLTESGILMVDNRLSGGGLFESATKQCSHCQATIIMNPLRTRARNWCMKCDAYVCDNPACNFECVPIKKVFDDAMEAAAKGQPVVIPSRFTA